MAGAGGERVLADNNDGALRAEAPMRFLELFYPFHYRVGFAVEAALGGAAISRQQTVILWLIYSEGIDGRAMRRKDIEISITRWFDVTSSAISKAIRQMAQPDFGLLTILEDPASGREKIVTLTPKGERFLAEMIKNGVGHITKIVAGLTDEQIVSGMDFLARVSEIDATLD
jgi:DNA-binding MarR family transcriptional regulator